MRVLIVDDSAVYRKILRKVFETFSEIDDIVTASNGKIALDKIKSLNPDIVSLDVEMPGMNGVDVLKKLNTEKISSDIIVVSSQTSEGAKVAIQALELGALDVIAKPDAKGMDESIKLLAKRLKPILDGVVVRHTIKHGKAKVQRKTIKAAISKRAVKKDKTPKPLRNKALCPDVVAIGASTGGPQALTKLLTALPSDIKVPIVVVLHMPSGFTAQLAKTINQKSKVKVVEAESGMVLTSGTAYLAPGGKHMKLVKDSKMDNIVIEITDDPPENHCKPSVDYLFRSVATVYKEKSMGVILTGMGADGVRGLKRMKRFEVKVIAQDEESSVIFGMPMEAIKAGVTDVVLPLGDIPDEIVNSLG